MAPFKKNLPAVGNAPRRRGLWPLALWGLVSVLTASAAPPTAADNADPRLGAPLEKRERAVMGSETAGIVVIEVSSFKCTHCRAFHEKIFPRLRAQYIDSGQVQWVVLNASDDAAEEFAQIFPIARCALRQGKYWELLDSLFQVAHRPPSFLADLIAKSPLIDRGELEICLRDRAVRNDVAADFTEYARLKIRGTPTFVVRKIGTDGRRTETTIAGAEALEYFQRAFDELLKSP